MISKLKIGGIAAGVVLATTTFAAAGSFTVTPRLYVQTFDYDDAVSGSVYAITPGGTIQYNRNDKWSYAITYFDGDGDKNINGATIDFDRSDLEAMAIYKINPQVNVGIGYRRVSVDLFENQLAIGNGTYNSEYDINFLQASLSMGAPLSSDGKHVLFAGISGMIGQSDLDYTVTNDLNDASSSGKGTSYGFDLNFGYGLSFSEGRSAHIRYRMTGYSVAGTGRTGSSVADDDFGIIHGPEIGLAFKF